jgi:type IV fimbrial biogenesis protein FimT
MGKQTGFTLIELLISIVLLAILLALAIPSLQSFVKNNRVTAQTNGLVSAIQLARSEALKRGTNSVICASNDAATCTGNDTWASGWIVYSDFDPGDGSDPAVGTTPPLCEANEDCILLVSDGLSGGNTLTSAISSISFLPSGLTAPGVGTAELKLISRDCEQEQARRIFVTMQGHTIVSRVGCT